MFTMLNVLYDNFLTRKPPFFTLFILSRISDNTTSQNIGGTNAWAVPPPQIFFGGDRPPSPLLGLRPWAKVPVQQINWSHEVIKSSFFYLFAGSCSLAAERTQDYSCTCRWRWLTICWNIMSRNHYSQGFLWRYVPLRRTGTFFQGKIFF